MIHENPILNKEILNSKIEITRFAHADLTTSWHSKKSFTNPINAFYMITKGEADLWCNGHHYHMTPGNIYVNPAGSCISNSCPKSFSKLYFCATLFNSNGETQRIAPLEGFVLTERGELIDKMMKLYSNKDYHSALRLRFYAEQIVMEIFHRSMEKVNIPNRSPLISEILQIINHAPHTSLSADALSECTHVSPSWLRQKFKKEMGISLGKYVLEKVLTAAAYDLRHSKMSLSAISTKYGFCDQFYFSRLFTAQFGIPPSRYRKEPII